MWSRFLSRKRRTRMWIRAQNGKVHNLSKATGIGILGERTVGISFDNYEAYLYSGTDAECQKVLDFVLSKLGQVHDIRRAFEEHEQ